MKNKKNKTALKENDPEYYLESFGYQLKEFMWDLGISQAEIAKKSGLSQQQISQILKGKNCTMKNFIKLCHALDFGIKLSPIKRKK